MCKTLATSYTSLMRGTRRRTTTTWMVPALVLSMFIIFRANWSSVWPDRTSSTPPGAWPWLPPASDPSVATVLIGNAGDGHINAFNPTSGAFLGQLEDSSGQPLAVHRLWGLSFGNDHLGGDANTLFFATGLDGERHGLFGAIQASGEHGHNTAGAYGFDPDASGERKDYPLPPSTGPALQTGNWTQSTVATLLPLSGSSLMLAPTLYNLPQFSAHAIRLPPPAILASPRLPVPADQPWWPRPPRLFPMTPGPTKIKPPTARSPSIFSLMWILRGRPAPRPIPTHKQLPRPLARRMSAWLRPACPHRSRPIPPPPAWKATHQGHWLNPRRGLTT